MDPCKPFDSNGLQDIDLQGPKHKKIGYFLIFLKKYPILTKNTVNQVKSSRKDHLYFIFVRSLYKTISRQIQETHIKLYLYIETPLKSILRRSDNVF